MSNGLAGEAVRGARDLGIAQVVKFAAYLVGLVVLSRLLTPEAFGVFAVATAFVGLAEYFRDFGLSVAAIRERDLPDTHRDALFWTNTALGVLLAALALILAQPLAWLFDMPALAGVVAALSGVFLINGVGAQYRASLTRERRYRRLAAADAAAAVGGLIAAIAAAVAGAEYWSLVAQALTVALLSTAVLIVSGRWRPRRPVRVSGMGRYYRFGADYAASQLIGYLGNNVDTIALGLWAGPRATGVYSRAFQLSVGTLDQVKAPAVTVALPSLSIVRDDESALMRFLLRGQLLLGYLTVPIAAAMFAGADAGVRLLLGSEWSDAAPIVAILAIAAALQQLATVASWLFVTSGHAARLRNYMIVSSTFKVVGVLIGVSFGAVGVALGYTMAVAIAGPVALIWSTRAAALPPAPLLLQGARLLGTGAVSAAIGLLCATAAAVAEAGAFAEAGAALLGVLGGYAIALAIPAVRDDYRHLVRAVRVALGRK